MIKWNSLTHSNERFFTLPKNHIRSRKLKWIIELHKLIILFIIHGNIYFSGSEINYFTESVFQRNIFVSDFHGIWKNLLPKEMFTCYTSTYGRH